MVQHENLNMPDHSDVICYRNTYENIRHFVIAVQVSVKVINVINISYEPNVAVVEVAPLITYITFRFALLSCLFYVTFELPYQNSSICSGQNYILAFAANTIIIIG